MCRRGMSWRIVKTLVDMLQDSASRFPGKRAIVCGDSQISYAELSRAAMALADYLVRVGLEKGQRVALMAGKTPEAVISFPAITAAGGVVLPVNCRIPPALVRKTLDFGTPSILVVAAEFLPLLASCGYPCRDTDVIVIGSPGGTAYSSWDTIIAGRVNSFPDAKIGIDDPAYLNFTSGSTGTPTAALATHGNIYWNTLSSVEALSLSEDDIHLCAFAMFTHPHEIFARPLYLGGTMVLVEGFSPRALSAAIEEHRVTCLMAVASVYSHLVRFRNSHEFDSSSLRLAESGGMPVSSQVASEFRQGFAIPITPVWGSTETTGVALACATDASPPPGSIGMPCPHYEIEVVDETGSPVGPDIVGEMRVRGPAVCRNYFDVADADALPLDADGWLATGDLVRRDGNNNYFFVDRKSRMLKVAGAQVFCSEIEAALRCHPSVADAAVVGASHPSRGEVPVAFVALREGADSSEIELRKFVAHRLSPAQMPRAVNVVPELPKTAGGKIMYKALAETTSIHQ